MTKLTFTGFVTGVPAPTTIIGNTNTFTATTSFHLPSSDVVLQFHGTNDDIYMSLLNKHTGSILFQINNDSNIVYNNLSESSVAFVNAICHLIKEPAVSRGIAEKANIELATNLIDFLKTHTTEETIQYLDSIIENRKDIITERILKLL